MVSLTFLFRKKYVLRKTAVQINRSFSYHTEKNANVCISNFSMNKVKSVNRNWLIYPFNFSVIASIFSAFYICLSQRKMSYKNILCYSITQCRIFVSISNFSFFRIDRLSHIKISWRSENLPNSFSMKFNVELSFTLTSHFHLTFNLRVSFLYKSGKIPASANNTQIIRSSFFHIYKNCKCFPNDFFFFLNKVSHIKLNC